MYVASIFGYYEYIEINAFITGSIAIGIISGAYSTEVFRGAIQSIDKGQFEAAKVLGINKFGQFYKIILPQMLRLAIPNLSNVWQITLKDTSLISVTAMLIGFVFALIFTPLKLSKYKSLNLIGNFYTTVIRGVPELLVIYLFFFGGSGAIMYVASIFGYFEYIEINAFITGSMAIGIISGAYSTEVFRGAIQSIDKGQFEAAKVLGVSKFVQFYKIILPQMLRLAIPNLSNVWQITLKDTSLISVTGLVEIMRQSYIAAGSTRDPLFFYSFAAVLYLLLTYLSMKLINRLEVKYSRGY